MHNQAKDAKKFISCLIIVAVIAAIWLVGAAIVQDLS